MDLLRQFYLLPHWDRSCRSTFPSQPAAVHWHQTDQYQRWRYYCQSPGRVVTRMPIFKSLVWLNLEKSHHKRDSNTHSWDGRLNHSGQWGGCLWPALIFGIFSHCSFSCLYFHSLCFCKGGASKKTNQLVFTGMIGNINQCVLGSPFWSLTDRVKCVLFAYWYVNICGHFYL